MRQLPNINKRRCRLHSELKTMWWSAVTLSHVYDAISRLKAREFSHCHKLLCFFEKFLSVVGVLGEDSQMFSQSLLLLGRPHWMLSILAVAKRIWQHHASFLRVIDRLTTDFVKRKEISNTWLHKRLKTNCLIATAMIIRFISSAILI